MGRGRKTQNVSPQRDNLGTMTMYKSFYKSQKRIQSISPKSVVKRKAELTVQAIEDQKYKTLERELKHKVREDEKAKEAEILKFKNEKKAEIVKNKRIRLEQEHRQKIEQYERKIKDKLAKVNKAPRENIRRASQGSSPDLRHIQSQENFDYGLLEKIEEKCSHANNLKLRNLSKRATSTHYKNMESQKRLSQYHQSQKNLLKSKEKQFALKFLKTQQKQRQHLAQTVRHQSERKRRNLARNQQFYQNKRGENRNAEERLSELMQKMEHNEQNIQKCKYSQ